MRKGVDKEKREEQEERSEKRVWGKKIIEKKS